MTVAEIRELRLKLMKRVAGAAAADDLVEVRRWSAAAQDCHALEQQAERVMADMQRLREMLRSGVTGIESPGHRAPTDGGWVCLSGPAGSPCCSAEREEETSLTSCFRSLNSAPTGKR